MYITVEEFKKSDNYFGRFIRKKTTTGNSFWYLGPLTWIIKLDFWQFLIICSPLALNDKMRETTSPSGLVTASISPLTSKQISISFVSSLWDICCVPPHWSHPAKILKSNSPDSSIRPPQVPIRIYEPIVWARKLRK